MKKINIELQSLTVLKNLVKIMNARQINLIYKSIIKDNVKNKNPRNTRNLK